jgi:anti-anti-sigma factor
MQFTTRLLADAVLLAVVGRVDHRTAGELGQALSTVIAPEGAGQGAVVLDFSGVEYISSVGLRALMVAGKQMRSREASFAIVGLQPAVAEIFAISRFDRVLAVYPDVASALARCSASALAAWQAAEAPPGLP